MFVPSQVPATSKMYVVDGLMPVIVNEVSATPAPVAVGVAQVNTVSGSVGFLQRMK